MSTGFLARLYFHGTNSLSRKVAKKRLNIVHNAVRSTLAGIAVQLVQRAWDALRFSCFAGPLRAVVHSYL